MQDTNAPEHAHEDEHTKEEHEAHHADVEKLKARVEELHNAVADIERRLFDLEGSTNLPQ